MMTEQKRYTESKRRVMQGERIVWSILEDDLLKSWTETFAELLMTRAMMAIATRKRLVNKIGSKQWQNQSGL